jgi:uncharacterized protein (DUF697 family)
VSLPATVGFLRALVKEISVSAHADRPLVVGGALADVLRRELGAAAGDDPRGAAVYVHVLGSGDDEAALKRARRARVPIVAVAPEEVDDVPYVLATDVVRVPRGAGFPLEEIARAVAGRLGEDAAPLAARMPVLRRAVGEQLVASFSRKNAIVAAAVFVPGAAFPLLVRNQVRMLLRLEQAYGLDPDPRQRVPEIAGTLAAGLGLRAAGRAALGVISVAGWAVQGAVAYAGTRALGQAALRQLEGIPGRRGH